MISSELATFHRNLSPRLDDDVDGMHQREMFLNMTTISATPQMDS